MLYKSIVFSALALFASVSANMSMIDPCPRFSPYCKNPPSSFPAGASWDNANIMAPIDPNSDVICKSNTPWPKPVATWAAGQPVTVEFKKGGTAHNGGHAQFSVSYDNGKTFAVVYEVLEHAFYNKNTYSDTPEVLKYTFTLPTDLPSSEKAVFAWSWVSPKADGSTSFYMNCADVEIKGSSSTSYTGRKTVIADVKGYPTIAASDSGFTWGLDYYTNAPNVTVSASNAAGKSLNTETFAPVKKDASSSENTKSRRLIIIPIVPGFGFTGKCKDGEMNCVFGSTGYQVCNFGKRVLMPCGAGTKCKATSSTVAHCE
ncbi:hypothetical protein H4217_000545 [Coemansia sp. RSA 1939]|nr:hypothetical protein H4217_000545 [Coemansia sp. RSA 1939]